MVRGQGPEEKASWNFGEKKYVGFMQSPIAS